MIQLTQKTPGPKTSLSKTYKSPTLVTTERMHVFMEANDLFPIEQKGCRRESYE